MLGLDQQTHKDPISAKTSQILPIFAETIPLKLQLSQVLQAKHCQAPRTSGFGVTELFNWIHNVFCCSVVKELVAWELADDWL